MADVTVTTNNNATITNYRDGNVFFTDEDTGYFFYHDNVNDNLVYRKTLDGGATWAGEVIVIDVSGGSGGGGGTAVWADWDTPGGSGSLIHAIQIRNPSDGDHVYRALDTSDDSLGSAGSITSPGSSFDSGGSPVTVTVGRSGHIFVLGAAHSAFGNTQFLVRSTDGGASFSSITGSGDPAIQNERQALAFPGNEVDDDDFYVLKHLDIDGSMTLYTYDASAGTWSSSLMTTVNNLGTIDCALAGAVYAGTGHTFVAFDNGNAGGANDIELWEITDATTFSKVGNVVENDAEVLGSEVSVTIDQANGDVYVSYIRNPGGADASSVFVKYDGSFGSEQALSETVTYVNPRAPTAPRTMQAGAGRFLGCWITSSANTTVNCNTGAVSRLATQSQGLPQIFMAS